MIKANEITIVSIEKLKINPKNRNIHPPDQIERLCNIIQYQGFRAPIMVSKRTDLVVAGHGRLMAAKKLGMTELPVIYQDFDDENQEYAAQISDNAIASWSDLDLSMINSDIGDFGPDFDIDLLGIKGFEIDVADRELGDEDATPEAPVEPKSKLGDVWTLGNHRLLCGDSTNVQHVERLMNGQKADMVFTDPPYNQGKSEGGFNNTRKGWSEHKQDRLNNFEPLDIFPIFEICGAQSGYFFCNKKLLGKYISWAESIGGWELIVMGKNNPIPTKHKKFLSDIEWLVFARREGAYFDDSLDYDLYRKVVMVNTKNREHGHPTEKQIEFISPYLQISSPKHGAVLDLFGGSGTTLIACEKLDRKCFMMELDPKYCDVILSRWAKYTGKDPVHENGTKWSELNG